MSDEMFNLLMRRLEKLEERLTNRVLDIERRLSRIEVIDWLAKLIIAGVITVLIKEVFFK